MYVAYEDFDYAQCRDGGEGWRERVPSVMNWITVEEVVPRSYSAMKKLVENNLNVGTTPINVIVKDGGLKFIQASNNSHDIRVRTLDNSNAFSWITSIQFQ